jgi:DNA-binding response OmpR family regulator
MFAEHPAVAILEKDSATCEMYRRELEHTCEVFPCVTEDEFWQILNTHDINVIVLEPDGLGNNKWDLIQKIKSNPRSMDLPIILISSQDMYDGSFKKELAACLVKPVLPSDLLLVIQQVMQVTR